MMEWTFLSVFCGILMVPHVFGTLTTTPSNTNASRSTDVTLHCVTDSDNIINWFKDTTITISVGETVINETEHGIITDQKGQFDLVIKSTTDSDAGSYQCRDFIPTEQSFQAELILLDDTISSNTTIPDGIIKELDSFYYECLVNYDGKWGPQIAFYNRGEEMPSDDTSVDGVARSSISEVAQRSMSGRQYSCHAAYTSPLDPAPGANEADNIPAYNREFQFNHVLQVHYGPENVRLSPDQGLIYVGTGMNCSFLSNPAPESIRFFHQENGGDEEEEENESRPVFIIPERYADGNNHTLRCQVTVYVGSGPDNETRVESSQDVTFVAQVITTTTSMTPSTPPSTTTKSETPRTPGGIGGDGSGGLGGGAIAAIVIVVIVLIVLLIIAAFCYMRRSKAAKKEASSPKSYDNQMDRVRTPSDAKPPLNTAGPPPYNGSNHPYENAGYYGTASTLPYSPASTLDRHSSDPYGQQDDNVGVIDRPRSRKPVQMMENSMEFSDVTLA